MRKILSLVLAVMLLFGLSAFAFAGSVDGDNGVKVIKAGRMTGGGNFTCCVPCIIRDHDCDDDGDCDKGCKKEIKVTHGFELYCCLKDGPNNLQVNWEGNRFHLEELKSVVCSNSKRIDPAPPTAKFDTIEGFGVGRYNGESGAKIKFRFTDAGEPGEKDTVCMTIFDKYGKVVLFCPCTKLDGGNHQAHNVNNSECNVCK